MLPGTAYTVSGILLSPTISIDKTEITPGETITVTGKSKPRIAVDTVTQPVVNTYNSASADDGSWTYTIPGAVTALLAPGVYQLRSQATDGGNLSLFSPTVNFTVRAPDTDNPPPACDISHGDLNCDTRVNLKDFSILLTHWNTNHRKADIVADGIVNLKDFSRMMFYFQK